MNLHMNEIFYILHAFRIKNFYKILAELYLQCFNFYKIQIIK